MYVLMFYIFFFIRMTVKDNTQQKKVIYYRQLAMRIIVKNNDDKRPLVDNEIVNVNHSFIDVPFIAHSSFSSLFLIPLCPWHLIACR